MKMGSFGGVIAVAALVGAGCGAGKAGEAVRPDTPTAAQALGEGQCADVNGKPGEPLIVDWKPEQRDDLEIAMKETVAIVAFSCKDIKVLPDCKLEGKYGFLGTTRKEQVVQLQNADELSVNLPLSGAKLGSEMKRGSTIDIAMVTIGKRRTTWDAPTSADLKGACKGATHFVRSASIGAFAMDTGSEGKVRAAAEMFGVGASGKSESGKKTNTKQGSLDDCAKSSPDSEKPPSQCGSPIRLTLQPLAVAPEASVPPPPPKANAKEEQKRIQVDEGQACPPGLVFAAGKCTKPGGAVAHVCKYGDAKDCEEQCEKGNAQSCGNLGAWMTTVGTGGEVLATKKNEQAFIALKKGCDGGSALACGVIGNFYVKGVGTKSDVPAATKAWEKGCAGGDPVACREYGRAFAFPNGPLPQDQAKAATLWRQACDGADTVGCIFLAHAYVEGTGVSKDPQKGFSYAQRACDGGLPPACNFAGEMLEHGKNVGKNPILAEMNYRRGCMRGADFQSSCRSLGRVLYVKNDPTAKMYLDRACAFGDAQACAIQKLAFSVNRPGMPDIAAMNDAMGECNHGDAAACTSWGLYQSLQSPAMAKPTLHRACTMNDAFGCAMEKKLP